MQLTEDQLITLQGLVSNDTEWRFLKEVFRAEIEKFWFALKHTDPADAKRVVANQRIAAGVEAALMDMVHEMEAACQAANNSQQRILPDVTQILEQWQKG